MQPNQHFGQQQQQFGLQHFPQQQQITQQQQQFNQQQQQFGQQQQPFAQPLGVQPHPQQAGPPQKQGGGGSFKTQQAYAEVHVHVCFHANPCSISVASSVPRFPSTRMVFSVIDDLWTSLK